MSNEEMLKLDKCILGVYMHCGGCERDISKALMKINGVFKVTTDRENNKVTVLGNVHPDMLIKTLRKKFEKSAEILDAPSGNIQTSKQPVDGGKGSGANSKPRVPKDSGECSKNKGPIQDDDGGYDIMPNDDGGHDIMPNSESDSDE